MRYKRRRAQNDEPVKKRTFRSFTKLRRDIPFAFKNTRFEWVNIREELGVEPQEESSLSRFYNDALREKMHTKNGCFWAREVYMIEMGQLRRE